MVVQHVLLNLVHVPLSVAHSQQKAVVDLLQHSSGRLIEATSNLLDDVSSKLAGSDQFEKTPPHLSTLFHLEHRHLHQHHLVKLDS